MKKTVFVARVSGCSGIDERYVAARSECEAKKLLGRDGLRVICIKLAELAKAGDL